jgi:hypothetical protein
MSPQTRALIDAILSYPGHVVATMRTKTEYVIEEKERGGRTVKEPRKIGLAPKFKDGLEYEFDVVANMDDALLTVSKSRCSALAEASIKKPGKPFADALLAWLDDGEDAPAPRRPVSGVDDEMVSRWPEMDEAAKRAAWPSLSEDTKKAIRAAKEQAA